ncbi:uncharacterized protein DNG_03936 [Cephalotrichum gorgonifer]|uniref:Uncharacterized protein n=1 Tax=Cephalotrichum gorgonifer TaxID=2041049 RepID=A0AAE8MX17_9PEZI|nr:uncharacterized protein DNG_03936 [Cephalotrichum gorgonifer]
MPSAFTWDDRDAAFDGLTDPSSQPYTSNSTQPQGKPVPAAAPPATLIQNFPITPPDHVQPSSLEPNRQTSHNLDFLRQDNMRLRNSNDQLRDEAEVLRRQNSGLQAQLDELRDMLRPLDRSLEELLYLPAVQNGEEGVSTMLFVILTEVTAVNKILSSGASKG